MTCLVAIKYKDYDKKGILFAADSMISSNRILTESPFCKIVKKSGLIIAITGSSRVSDIVQYQLEPKFSCFGIQNKEEEFKEYVGKHFVPDLITLFRENLLLKEKDNVAKDEHNFSLLIGFQNQIYCIHHNFAIVEAYKYTAAGSGTRYALGSIHSSLEVLKEHATSELMLKEQAVIIATRAIKAAAYFDFFVDDNITFEFLEEDILDEVDNKRSQDI